MTGDQQPLDSPHQLTARLDLSFALKAAGLGVWELDPVNNLVNWDDRCRELFGLAKDNLLSYEKAIQHIHPDYLKQVDESVRWAMSAQSGGDYDVTYRTIGADDGLLRWVRFIGQGYFNEAGEVYRFAGVAQDVTNDVQMRQQYQLTGLLQAVFDGTAAGVSVLRSIRDEAGRIVDFEYLLANRVTEQINNRTDLVGQRYSVVHTEYKRMGLFDHFATVVETGQFAERDFHYTGEGFDNWYATVISKHEDGVVFSFRDVTAERNALSQLDQSEARFRTIVQQSPAATLVLRGEEYVIEQVNEPMLAIMGRGDEVIGQPLLAIMPEVDGQFAWQQAKRVYQQGIEYDGYEVFVTHRTGERMVDRYYNLAYRPLREDGQITGMIQVVNDVTEGVVARQQVEETAIALRNAIELAELGTFSVDVATQVITVSPRVAEWFGFESLRADAEVFIGGVGERDRDHVRTSLYNTLLPDSDGRYDVVHSVVHAQTGRQIILHALGQVYRDTNGQPVRVEGTAQDVTLQREVQLSLEREVQQRTEELAAANKQLATANEELAAMNEELSASNEELSTSNEELTESTGLLTRSNDNLQQFAYVASHDLQEPLRKIQSFGDVLKDRYADQLGDGINYLERMQVAAGRMSTLIKDLLTFSRIATQQDTSEAVSLAQVVATAVADLDLLIQETGAVIVIQPLPVVQGDFSQLGQLFLNLLSNALKFRRPDSLPLIKVSVQTLAASQLPISILPGRTAKMYHRIDVSDNGIGFDEKYLDRIFQVFQRLHGKGDFSGTGIGLAICEKVVLNHGGVITATSQVGQGATFSVYLPM